MTGQAVWMQDATTGEVRSLSVTEAAAMAPPWWEISAESALREHWRSTQ